MSWSVRSFLWYSGTSLCRSLKCHLFGMEILACVMIFKASVLVYID